MIITPAIIAERTTGKYFSTPSIKASNVLDKGRQRPSTFSITGLKIGENNQIIGFENNLNEPINKALVLSDTANALSEAKFTLHGNKCVLANKIRSISIVINDAKTRPK